MAIRYIASADNKVADWASRNMSTRHTEWSLCSAFFKTILPLIKQCNFDLFASHVNAKFPAFCSWYPNPGASHIDAFTLDWNSHRCYAFPPFRLLPRCLSYIRNHRVKDITFLVPYMLGQIWFPDLLQLVVCPPLILPKVVSQHLTNSVDRARYPVPLHLVLARLSTDALERKAFHRMCQDSLHLDGQKNTCRNYDRHVENWFKFNNGRGTNPYNFGFNKVCDNLMRMSIDHPDYKFHHYETHIAVLTNMAKHAQQELSSHDKLVLDTLATAIFKKTLKAAQVKPLTATWDVNDVLDYYGRLPSNKDLSLYALSRKCAMLMLLSTMRRIGELAMLDLRFMTKSSTEAVFQLVDLVKTATKTRRPGALRNLQTFTVEALPGGGTLCPLECLEAFIKKSTGYRGSTTELFVTHSGAPVKGAAVRTISRWIRQDMTAAGITMIAPGSVRHASSSGALKAGIGTDLIMKKAGWLWQSTFVRYYLRKVYSAKDRCHIIVSNQQRGQAGATPAAQPVGDTLPLQDMMSSKWVHQARTKNNPFVRKWLADQQRLTVQQQLNRDSLRRRAGWLGSSIASNSPTKLNRNTISISRSAAKVLRNAAKIGRRGPKSLVSTEDSVTETAVSPMPLPTPSVVLQDQGQESHVRHLNFECDTQPTEDTPIETPSGDLVTVEIDTHQADCIIVDPPPQNLVPLPPSPPIPPITDTRVETEWHVESVAFQNKSTNEWQMQLLKNVTLQNNITDNVETVINSAAMQPESFVELSLDIEPETIEIDTCSENPPMTPVRDSPPPDNPPLIVVRDSPPPVLLSSEATLPVHRYATRPRNFKPNYNENRNKTSSPTRNDHDSDSDYVTHKKIQKSTNNVTPRPKRKKPLSSAPLVKPSKSKTNSMASVTWTNMWHDLKPQYYVYLVSGNCTNYVPLWAKDKGYINQEKSGTFSIYHPTDCTLNSSFSSED